MLYAVQVLLPLPLAAFSFLLPHDQTPPAIGCRVVVPWQQGLRLGLVSDVSEVRGGKSLELKELVSVLEATPFIDASRIAFIQDVAAYTCTPAGLVLATLLPTGLSEPLRHTFTLVNGVTHEGLQPGEWYEADDFKPADIELLRQQGLIRERVTITQPTKRVLIAQREPDEALNAKRASNQKEALELLLGREFVESAAELSREAGVPESAVRSLIKKGYAAYADIPAPPPALAYFEGRAPRPVFDVTLPDGDVSLSGGTREARLACLLPRIKATLTRGRSVLILCPEQIIAQETARYLSNAHPVQYLSGELSDTQRERLWRELQDGDPVVLVGSYLTLLAPLPDPGLIIVLEEGNSSYKLQSGPRLFVPFVARRLAKQLSIPLITADALASLESWQAAEPDKRIMLDASKQRIHVVDLSSTNNWPLSSDLIRVLRQVQERDRQAIILAPRRGFSAALECERCGFVMMCPNCDLPLRYHREGVRLACHQCGFKGSVPDACPDCGQLSLKPSRAAGTQWVVRALEKQLDGIRVFRFDGDQRDDLSSLLAGEPGIVVATTAIFRHEPLVNVSLIAITLLDTLLTFSDFRAEEETLRLLLQLCELAPEGRPLTLIQTFQPEHSVLSTVKAQDAASVEAFLSSRLERRKLFAYPPFAHLAKVQVSARDEASALQEAERMAAVLATAGANDREMLGPSPAPVVRIRRFYSYQIFLRSDSEARLAKLLDVAQNYGGRARIRIEVDPRDIGSFLV